MPNIYSVEVRHQRLNKYREIRGRDPYIVEEKARVQLAQWDEMWAKKLAAAASKQKKEDAAAAKQLKREVAAQRTEEAQLAIQELDKILHTTLTIDDRVDWKLLHNTTPFDTPEPQRPEPPQLPSKPAADDRIYQPDRGLAYWLFPWVRAKRKREKKHSLLTALENWKVTCNKHNTNHQQKVVTYENQYSAWITDRNNYEADRVASNNALLDLEKNYLKQQSDAIQEYCDLVLSQSQYPDSFPKNFDLEYRQAGKILIVEYQLPIPTDIPSIESVRYIQSRDEFVEKTLTPTKINRIYDSIVYQICLRTLHELFEADTVDAIQSVALNAYTDSIDSATGHHIKPCIASIQVSKNEFEQIKLDQVDPKACFKKLKGIGSSKLHSMSAVAPIISIDHSDDRFVAPRDQSTSLEEGYNLAAMPWEDFEHLVREIFEQEFASNGGEVKITQASRDGGVDAIAFDPDPIRGGKIVIQAKRYTNTVGVASVRDLYGTLMNEGATKGILVTTSDYGPDAYSFAKGKPITLLNGSNLLHLLSKHGTNAHINLKAAKKLIKTIGNSRQDK